ncbi:MAG: sensor histidine kinase, partial [Chitinophagaceae bacterium]
LNEMKSRFVSMASHEFRTPLATILSSLTLVSKYGELGEKEKQHRHIQRIKNSISYLTDLLNDVLSISKLEEGKVSIVPLQCKAEDYIKQILEDLKPLTKKGQIIRYTHSGNALMCQDVKILKIIITNLVSNAIKFSNENTIVELRTKASSHLFEIEIQDYGVGISAEDQEHLFERFFRGNNVTNIQGTGLGLNIVARYLEILGGEIHVKSQLNEGTTFLVQLPNIINYE